MATELKQDALELAHSLALGVAGSAPTFSISATLVTLIGTVGILAPASLAYCGLMMLGIVFAYMHLNAREPNAGASYAWVSAIFGRGLGFFAGWALLVSSALFMVSATLPAGSATLLLLAPEYAESQFAVTACAALWLAIVTVIIVKGIALTGRVQFVMTGLELVILTLISLLAVFRFGGHALHALSWRDFAPGAFSPSAFANGAVIALFFFWGWDVSLNLTEETREPGKAPGIGAIGAVIVIIAAFTAFAAIALLVLGDEEIGQSGTNIVFAVADKLMPRPWSYLAVLALMLSTIGTLETSMLQFSRTLFAKSRDGLLHPRWARVHEEWRTPHTATFLIASLGLLLLISSLSSKNIAEVMKESINVIGVQAACYYGLAGLACAWAFRARARHSPWAFLTMLLWPTLSALALWWAAALTIMEFDLLTAFIAVGSMLLGMIPLLLAARKARRGSYPG